MIVDAQALIGLLVGYGLGSIPFGYLLARWGGAGDVRAIGSGNIGATNVLRTGRKGLAAATLLLDIGKGAAAVLMARHGIGGEWPALAAGVGAMAGHIWPVWLRFKGGKGVATLLGVSVAALPIAGLAFALTWVAATLATRISSVGGMLGGFAAATVALIAGRPALAAALLALALWVVWTHRANIARLRAGTEPRIGAASR